VRTPSKHYPPSVNQPRLPPAVPPTKSTAWSDARLVNQTLVNQTLVNWTGQQGDAVLADLLAEVLAGDIDA